MTPFIARYRDHLCLVLAFVVHRQEVVAVVAFQNRKLEWIELRDLTLEKMNQQMPVGFFEWPEAVPA